jgi:hypothetical protein
LKKTTALGKVGSMKREQILTLCFFLLFNGGFWVVATETEHPAVISTSPDHRFTICREHASPGDLGEARKSLSICSREGKTLYEWFSGIGTTTALWSPDGRFVAINDMPGDKGDLLRLFALDPSVPSVIPIRDPDRKKLRRELESRHGSFLSVIEAVNLRASEWKEGKLWCQVSGTFSPKRQSSVHVPFHHLWVLKTNGKNPPVIEQEWTLTDPKEMAYRDENR